MLQRDPWLDRWLPMAATRAGGDPVLEIGCGHGDDTVVLAKAGLQVIAFDCSSTAVAIAKLRAPSANISCGDIRDPFPLPAAQQRVGLVVASLCLHYFPWDETQAFVHRIHAALRPGGLLLCRLNSTEDHNFGASGHPKIEPHFFMVKGEPKRFFDAASVDALFATGWQRVALEHIVTCKYAKPKAAWEVVLEKAD